MVDVDGVIIVPCPDGWAVDLEADLGITREVLQTHFFKPHWNDVVLGRAALHERLGPVLAEHAPHLTSHQLTTYWFEKDAQLDKALLSDLATLRATGVQLHLATIQEHERAAYLWSTLGLRDHFDAMHYAADIGWKKTDPEFYAVVEARTGFSGTDRAPISCCWTIPRRTSKRPAPPAGAVHSGIEPRDSRRFWRRPRALDAT